MTKHRTVRCVIRDDPDDAPDCSVFCPVSKIIPFQHRTNVSDVEKFLSSVHRTVCPVLLYTSDSNLSGGENYSFPTPDIAIKTPYKSGALSGSIFIKLYRRIFFYFSSYDPDGAHAPDYNNVFISQCRPVLKNNNFHHQARCYRPLERACV